MSSRAGAKFEIDSERLRELVGATGLTLSEASKKLGFSSTYINQVLASGTVTEVGAKLIEHELHIPFEAYRLGEIRTQKEEKADDFKLILAELTGIRQILTELLEVWKG